MSDEIIWLTWSATFEHQGWLDWKWQVKDERGYHVDSGYTCWLWTARRQAKRHRKGTMKLV